MDFEAVAGNLRESFRIIASSHFRGEVRELRGVSIASAGVTFQMFNSAFVSSPVLTEIELEQRIVTAAVHFQARRQAWSYWVCEDWMAPRPRRRASKTFDRMGLRHAVDLPGMVAEKLNPPAEPLMPIEARRVCDANTRAAFCAIGSLCFHVPLPWFEEVFSNESVWGRFASYVGYVDGEPVATVSVINGAGVRGIYNLATVPDRQRRGFAEALMRYALDQHGDAPVILQSTPAGLHLYERMGFRTITQVAVYST